MISNEQVQTALEEARAENTANAWDTYEELVSAKAHQKEPVSPLIAFCELNPYAPECRMYDV